MTDPTDEQCRAYVRGMVNSYTAEQVRTMTDAEFRQAIIDILRTIWPDDDYSDFLVEMKGEEPHAPTSAD
jgi:hypothetical protein